MDTHGWVRTDAWKESSRRIWQTPQVLEVIVFGADVANTTRYRIGCTAEHP